MLTRNCATSLFKTGDFNVRVTLFDKNSKYYTPKAYKAAWFETIRDSLGGGNIQSNVEKTFYIVCEDSKNYHLFKGTTRELIQKMDYMFLKPVSIRISLLDEKEKSWIILIP